MGAFLSGSSGRVAGAVVVRGLASPASFGAWCSEGGLPQGPVLDRLSTHCWGWMW